VILRLIFCDYYGNVIEEIPWTGGPTPSTITREVGPLKMGFRRVIQEGNWAGYRAILTEVPRVEKTRNKKIS